MDELNLAENLGLSTNNKYQNQMPFTRAANTELNLAIQQKREEQKRAEQERQMQKEITNRIKFKGDNLDKIGRDIYSREFTKAVSEGFSPEHGYNLQILAANEEDEGNTYKKLKTNINKFLLPQDVKAAYGNDDYEYLRKKAQEDPRLGIIITPSGRPLLDANRVVEDVNVDNYFSGLQKQLDNKDEYWLPKKNGKVQNQFGRVLTEAVLRPEVYQQEANKIFTIDPSQSPEDQTLERNYLIKRQKEIDAELAKPIYKNIANDEERLITAAKNVFINEAKSKVTKFVENKVNKGSGEGKGTYSWSGNIFSNGKGNSWTYTYDPSVKKIGVNTRGNTGVSSQGLLMSVVNPDDKSVAEPKYKQVKIMAISPIDDNKWEVTVSKESGGEATGIATDEALTSYMADFNPDELRKGYYSKARPKSTGTPTPLMPQNTAETNKGFGFKTEIPQGQKGKQTKKVEGKKDNNL
jgi:hypothetical protein